MSQGKTCGKRCAFLYKALTTTPLFRGYNAAEVEKICGLLKARLKHYAARALVVHECMAVKDLFVVISGKVVSSICGLTEDRRHQLMYSIPGDLIGSTFPEMRLEGYPFLMTAVGPSESLLLDVEAARELIRSPGYGTLLRNMLNLSGRRCVQAVRKLAVMSCYETSDRILLYLRHHYEDTGDRLLAFKRTELAEYLGVNRTALYRSITKLVESGAIRASRGKLELLLP